MSPNRDKLTAIPRDDGQIIRRSGPLHFISLFLEFLELHCQLTLADFVIREGLEMRSKADPKHGSDEPFGWVILVPFDGVTVVHWELMMEVMVSLADGNESGENVIARGVLVIERGFTEPVSEGVDAERGLYHVRQCDA
jgi:hypothetical protein